MARARNIKPGFFKNEDLAECSPWARLCFAGLWVLADREGRLEDRPKRIKGELFAFDSIEVEPLLAELESFGFLERYRNEDGAFIQISKFTTHQTPHYSEKPSVIKPPRLQESAPHEERKKPGGLQEDSKNPQGIKRGSQPPDSLIPDSPNPDSLIPELKPALPDATTSRAPAAADPETPSTAYGRAARAMRDKGCAANPGDPRLRTLVDQGATLEEFAAVAEEAAGKAKGPAWALVALVNRRQEAADTTLAPQPKAEDWSATRQGVIDRACAIGIGPFDEGAAALGTGPTWTRYRATVIAAASQQGATA